MSNNNNNKRSLPQEAWCECSHCNRRADGGMFVSVSTWHRHNKGSNLKLGDVKRRRRTNNDDMDVVGKY